jgi:hypothetical protein
MTEQEEMWRGERARQLMNEPLIKEALEEIERAIIQNWEQCPAKDIELREKLWMMYGVSKKFRSYLQSTMESGELASLQLAEKKRFSLFGG